MKNLIRLWNNQFELTWCIVIAKIYFTEFMSQRIWCHMIVLTQRVCKYHSPLLLLALLRVNLTFGSPGVVFITGCNPSILGNRSPRNKGLFPGQIRCLVVGGGKIETQNVITLSSVVKSLFSVLTSQSNPRFPIIIKLYFFILTIALRCRKLIYILYIYIFPPELRSHTSQTTRSSSTGSNYSYLCHLVVKKWYKM